MFDINYLPRSRVLFFSLLQMLMNASLQMLVEPILSVITPLGHTDVIVQMVSLLTAVYRIH